MAVRDGVQVRSRVHLAPCTRPYNLQKCLQILKVQPESMDALFIPLTDSYASVEPLPSNGLIQPTSKENFQINLGLSSIIAIHSFRQFYGWHKNGAFCAISLQHLATVERAAITAAP